SRSGRNLRRILVIPPGFAGGDLFGFGFCLFRNATRSSWGHVPPLVATRPRLGNQAVVRARSGGRIGWIDGARAIGALLVLVFHATQNVPVVGWINAHVIGFGRLGVLLLVMQGGYLIPRLMTDTEVAPARFWVGRAIRFYPAYWAALAGYVTILAVTGDLVPNARTILLNATYFPELFGAPFVMGSIWTMAFVLACYAAVTFGMIAFHRSTIFNAAVGGALILIAISLVGLMLGKDPLNRLSVPCAFLAGTVLREARERGLAPRRWGLALLATVMPVLVVIPSLLSGKFDPSGFAYVVVALVAAIAIQIALTWWNPEFPTALRTLGGMSYSIYLAQAPVLLLFQHWSENLVTMAVRVGSSLLVGYALYRLVESPSSSFARRWVRRK
ncbi:acyltransferase, partial [bacterium]